MGSRVVVVIVVLIFGSVPRLGTDREAAWNVGRRGASWNAHGTRCTADRRANGHARRQSAMWSIETSLDEILTLWLGNQGLKLGGGEGVHQTSLGYDEKEDLSTCECR